MHYLILISRFCSYDYICRILQTKLPINRQNETQALEPWTHLPILHSKHFFFKSTFVQNVAAQERVALISKRSTFFVVRVDRDPKMAPKKTKFLNRKVYFGLVDDVLKMVCGQTEKEELSCSCPTYPVTLHDYLKLVY